LRRFAAVDSHRWANAFRAQTGPAEQAATADRSKYGIQIVDLFEELFGGCRLAGDHAVVVIGVNHQCAGFGLDSIRGFIARGHRRFA